MHNIYCCIIKMFAEDFNRQWGSPSYFVALPTTCFFPKISYSQLSWVLSKTYLLKQAGKDRQIKKATIYLTKITINFESVLLAKGIDEFLYYISMN